MFHDIDNELVKLLPRTMDWDRLAGHARRGTHSKLSYNKFGKRNKARLITATDSTILTWISPNNMPKKGTRAKHRTKTIFADLFAKGYAKTTHY